VQAYNFVETVIAINSVKTRLKIIKKNITTKSQKVSHKMGLNWSWLKQIFYNAFDQLYLDTD
jgi:hypothetical protein